MIVEIEDGRGKLIAFNKKDILSVSLNKTYSRSDNIFTYDLNVGLRNTSESWEYLTFTDEAVARDTYNRMLGHLADLDK